ncbi:MAG: MBL fold metallo-hydrolase, partial [Candidatus Brocadiia bacterium]
RLRFLGAAQNVTGSRHMLEVNGIRVLIDCGLYQERHFLDRNWDPFPVPASSINAVLLTHAHLDHCGLLPKLVKEGFRGKIYCTSATAEIAKIILLDSAHIQEEDAAYKKKRHEKQGKVSPHGYEPLYTTEDAEASLPYFQPVHYREVVEFGKGAEATFFDAGHVLGSAIIRAKVRKDGEERIILFSGDMGRPDRPIVCDPTVFDKADYVLLESTYGNRVHQGTESIKEQIGKVINGAVKAGGKIIIPAFALERSQEVMYYINELLIEKAIPPLKVYIDSPMASKITEVFVNHPEMTDCKMAEFTKNHGSPFKFEGLEFVGSTEESKALNDKKGSFIVIAGSGMCTGGRIKHHLVNNISDPKNTIMFVGYQAVGTLGRLIVDGKEKVRILGEQRNVRAKILKVTGFSAHADRDELLKWLKSLKKAPRQVFVVHGEENSAKEFGDFIRQQTGWNVTVPAYKDEVTID